MEAAVPSAVEAFTHEMRVGWADCDPARIAFTGRIPYFALEAIDAWWERHVGADWYRMNLDRGVGTPFVHLSVDFRKPVTPRFPLECRVRLLHVGTSSVRFRVEGRQDGALAFEGEFVEVFVATGTQGKIAAPADIRRLIEPLIEKSAEAFGQDNA